MIKEEGHNQMKSQLPNILQKNFKVNKDKSTPSRYKQKIKNKNQYFLWKVGPKNYVEI